MDFPSACLVMLAVPVLAACGAGGGGGTGGGRSPAPSASASDSTDPYCRPSAGLPAADAVADVSLPSRQHPVSIRVGQTVRVQAEQRCGGHHFGVVAGDKGAPQLDLVRSGGALAPGTTGTGWALYRGVQPGTKTLELVGGAWCESGQPCPLYAIAITQQVTVLP